MTLTGTAFGLLTPVLPASGHGGRLYGVYTAIVTDVDDPEGMGRVRIRLPWTTDQDGDAYELWARVATLMAGNDRGTWFIPEPDDEVLIAFAAGDPRRPYVVGALWNGQDTPLSNQTSMCSPPVSSAESALISFITRVTSGEVCV